MTNLKNRNDRNVRNTLNVKNKLKNMRAKKVEVAAEVIKEEEVMT